MSNFLFKIISGFSMYFWTTQIGSEDKLMALTILSILLCIVMPRPREDPPGFKIQAFLFPIRWYYLPSNYCKLSKVVVMAVFIYSSLFSLYTFCTFLNKGIAEKLDGALRSQKAKWMSSLIQSMSDCHSFSEKIISELAKSLFSHICNAIIILSICLVLYAAFQA